MAFCICDGNFRHLQMGYPMAETACLKITNGDFFRLLCPFLYRLSYGEAAKLRLAISAKKNGPNALLFDFCVVMALSVQRNLFNIFFAEAKALRLRTRRRCTGHM